ncbi:MAG: hypothetical protein JWP57_2287 [Spirosoma sp.]|nr:hypothetical protein [Spirosoma sp.]
MRIGQFVSQWIRLQLFYLGYYQTLIQAYRYIVTGRVRHKKTPASRSFFVSISFIKNWLLSLFLFGSDRTAQCTRNLDAGNWVRRFFKHLNAFYRNLAYPNRLT